MTLTLSELRAFVDTPVDDAALQKLLDAAYEAIAAVLGPSGPVAEYLTTSTDLLFLSRPAETVGAVIELGRTLTTDDYEIRASGQTLRRLRTGPHPAYRWRGRIDVTYTPPADDADRDRVAMELVKLDLTVSPGVVSESLGDWSVSYVHGVGTAYQDLRQNLIDSLAGGAVGR